MSVDKMKKYKEDKANRKENLAKEKQKKNLIKTLTWAGFAAVVILFAVAIGVTIHNQIEAKKAAMPDYTSMDSYLLEDLAGVRPTEEAHEEEAEVQESAGMTEEESMQESAAMTEEESMLESEGMSEEESMEESEGMTEEESMEETSDMPEEESMEEPAETEKAGTTKAN